MKKYEYNDLLKANSSDLTIAYKFVDGFKNELLLTKIKNNYLMVMFSLCSFRRRYNYWIDQFQVFYFFLLKEFDFKLD